MNYVLKPIYTIFYNDIYKIFVLKNIHEFVKFHADRKSLSGIYYSLRVFAAIMRFTFFLIPVRLPSNVLYSCTSPFSLGLCPLHPTISFRSLPRTFTRSRTVTSAVLLVLPRIAWPSRLYSTTTRKAIDWRCSRFFPKVPIKFYFSRICATVIDTITCRFTYFIFKLSRFSLCIALVRAKATYSRNRVGVIVV